MKKVVVYGMGGFYRKIKNEIEKEAEIVAYANTNEALSTSQTGNLFEGKEILTVSEIANIEFDSVYICTEAYNANPIYELLRTNNIPSSKIEFLWKRVIKGVKWIDHPVEDGFISDIDGIKILQRFHTDYDFVPEVFYYNTYNIDLGDEDCVVIDVGMNIGIASLFFASKSSVKKVYGYEPFPDTFDQAIANFGLNEVIISQKIIPHNIGLSNKDEELDIAISADESGYRDIFSPASNDNSVHIVCKDAGTIVNEIASDNKGYKIILKVDTEGSEYDIFDSLKRNDSFKRIDSILMEYHKGSDVLVKQLKEEGFKLLMPGAVGSDIGMLYAFR